MDIKEFAQEFQENVKIAAEMGNTDFDTEVAKGILEYMEDNGEVNARDMYVSENAHKNNCVRLQ